MKRCSLVPPVIALWLTLGCTAGWAAAVPTNSPAGLDEAKKQFEAAMRDLQRQEREAPQLLKQRYLAGLAALEDSLQAAGNLTAVLAMHGEKARFEQSGDIPDTALAADLPALQKLQEAWRTQTAALPREQALKLVGASERYLQSLAGVKKALAAKGDARGLEDVKAESERLLSNQRVREALALVQAERKTTPGGASPPVAEPKGAEQSPFWPFIHRAIAEQMLKEWPAVGGAFAKDHFTEVPKEDAILIGFNYTTIANGQYPGFIQAIYQTTYGEMKGPMHGKMTSRLFTVKAKRGYAIGALFTRGGGGLDAFKPTFMKIEKQGLRVDDAYEGPHIGGNGGGEGTVGGDGNFIVGICGKIGREGKVEALSVVSLDPGAAKAPAR